MTQISYTSAGKYTQCPKEYALHYKDKIRPTALGSALIFGNAFDEAIMALLGSNNVLKARQALKRHLTISKDVFGNRVFVPTSQDVVYNANDIDEELLTPEDRTRHVAGKAHMAWLSLHRKGLLLIDGFNTHVLPNIKRVIAVQHPIRLENEHGDIVTGKCDFVVEWHDGRIIAFDLKSAGMPYERDAVQSSTQLATYFLALGDTFKLDAVGYIVGLKNIRKNRKKKCIVCGYDGSGTRFGTCNNTLAMSKKRCNGEWNESINPQAGYQTLIDNIPQHFLQLTLDNLNAVNNGIKQGVFFRNLNACVRPYGKCAYYNYCHGNKDMTGLVQK